MCSFPEYNAIRFKNGDEIARHSECNTFALVPVGSFFFVLLTDDVGVFALRCV
jgi:hypothetical protein